MFGIVLLCPCWLQYYSFIISGVSVAMEEYVRSKGGDLMARSPIKYLKEKEGIAALFFLVICTALALTFPPSVGTSNQAPAAAHAVAPWIFGPFQMLLLYLPPWLGALMVPIIILAGLAGLPWLVDYLGVKWGSGIFITLIGFVLVLLLWFRVKELWWN